MFFDGERVWHTLLKTRYIYIRQSPESPTESVVHVTTWEDDSFDAFLVVQTDLLRSDDDYYSRGQKVEP